LKKLKNIISKNIYKINFLITVICFIFVYQKINFFDAYLNFVIIDYYYLVGSLFTLIFSFLLGTFKWKILIDRSGNSITYLKLQEICFIGSFISNFVLGSLFGDASRLYFQSLVTGISYAKALLIGILDRLFTLASYLLTIILIYLLIEDIFLLLFFLFLLFISFFALTIILSKLRVDFFYYRFTVAILKSNDFLKIILLGVLNASLIGAGYLLILKSLGCDFKAVAFPKILIGLLPNYLPFSLAGWGVREVSLVQLLQNNSCADSNIFSGSVIFGLWGILISLPGIFFLPKFLRYKNIERAKS